MGRHDQPVHVDATFYAQVEPSWSRYWAADDDGNRKLEGAKVTTITQQRPARPKPGTVLVKLTLRMPAGVFMPLAPEAVVVIPADLTELGPIEVEAVDPRDCDGDEEDR